MRVEFAMMQKIFPDPYRVMSIFTAALFADVVSVSVSATPHPCVPLLVALCFSDFLKAPILMWGCQIAENFRSFLSFNIQDSTDELIFLRSFALIYRMFTHLPLIVHLSPSPLSGIHPPQLTSIRHVSHTCP